MKTVRRVLFAIGILLVIGAGALWAVTSYLNSSQRGKPLVYSNEAELYELWNAYKKANIEPSSHRTYDLSQNGITTSEGESYTMLRAVWMDDQTTFDQSWQFTQDNLQRNDSLFSWKYGQVSPGKYGVLTNDGGNNTASDADTDIALSLLMAYRRWNDTKYFTAAKPIIASIWQNEVVTVAGKPVLAADNLEQADTAKILVNPSYFSPYSYRIFAQADKNHDWTGLLNNMYSLVAEASSSNLDKTSSADLPPNWVYVNRSNGTLAAATNGSLDSNYGYDAFRLPWRLALDYQWYSDTRDKTILSSFSFLQQQWQQGGKLAAVYSHDGTVVSDYESPAMYGAAMGYFVVADPANAKTIYTDKLQTLYSPDSQSWKQQPNYYEDNWAWFGIALTQKALPNLAVGS